MKNNLNLIIGEDKKLIDFYLDKIISNIDYLEENKITYDMHENNISNIIDEASMISLFASTKIIIGDNFDISKINADEYEYLTKYVNNLNTDAYIILIADKVDARTKNYKIFKDKFNIIDTSKSDTHDDLNAYIKNRIKENNYKIDSYDIEYFLEKVGNDINNINTELDKLFIYKEKEKTINREDIELLIIDNIDNVIYEFTNAVLDKDIDKIAKMYHNFKIENVTPDYLISSLSNTFRQSLIIKMLHNSNKSNLDIAKTIGKKEFYVKKMLERLYPYTEEDIGNLIIKLANVDNDIKSGKSNLDSLEMFLINL